MNGLQVFIVTVMMAIMCVIGIIAGYQQGRHDYAGKMYHCLYGPHEKTIAECIPSVKGD